MQTSLDTQQWMIWIHYFITVYAILYLDSNVLYIL